MQNGWVFMRHLCAAVNNIHREIISRGNEYEIHPRQSISGDSERIICRRNSRWSGGSSGAAVVPSDLTTVTSTNRSLNRRNISDRLMKHGPSWPSQPSGPSPSDTWLTSEHNACRLRACRSLLRKQMSLSPHVPYESSLKQRWLMRLQCTSLHYVNSSRLFLN